MEQIPRNTIEEKLISDYEITKNDFINYFSNLMESNESILEQIYKMIESIRGDLSQSDANVALNDEIINSINKFLQNKSIFILDNLKVKLKSIIEDYSTTVLDDLFDSLISLWIEKNREKTNFFFISLKQIFEVFNLLGFRLISGETLDKLTGALQWNIILPFWLNYNFLKDYFDELSSNKEITKELKNKTWTLVELTRIKKQELEEKISQYLPKDEFPKN